MTKKSYYTLSFTWGLPLTVCGLLIAAALMAVGYRPKRYGWMWQFEVGENWGGLSLGIVFLCCKNSSPRLMMHEFGHSIQNCRYGIGMILFTALSALRYHYIIWMESHGKSTPDYDSWWFEGQATKIGTHYITNIIKGR